eukprot:NODE_109_length_18665_cov_0.924486.p5 type:complete len:428 gc:universal NODE_109_length_18665_cov_0.924486:11192-12475(+)
MNRSKSKNSAENPIVKQDTLLRKTMSRVTAMIEEDFLLNEDKTRKRRLFWNFIHTIWIAIAIIAPYIIAISFQSTFLLDFKPTKKVDSDIWLTNEILLSQEMQRWSILLCSVWAVFVLVYSILTIIPFFIFEFLKIFDSNPGKLTQTIAYLKGLKISIVRLACSICCASTCSVLWGASSRTPNDFSLPNYIYIALGLFQSIIFYCSCLLLKKIFIISLYFKLRERTYKERISFSKKAVSMIEHLRSEIGKKLHAEKFLSEARLHWKEDIEFYNYDNLFDKLGVDHAKEIFLGVGKGKHHLIAGDFKPYFPTEEEAIAAFQIFAGDEGKTELHGKDLKETIIQIYRERRRLNDNIRDMNGSISKLEGIFNVFSLIVSALFCVAYFDNSFLRASLPIFSSMLALSFLFAESAKELFINCIFLFKYILFT